MANTGGFGYPSGGGAQPPRSNTNTDGDGGKNRSGRGSRSTVIKGKTKSSKGVAGVYHKRPDGKVVFVAKPGAKPSTGGSGTSGGSAATPPGGLSVGRFRQWDTEHQRQFIKFYMNNRTPEEFWAMPLKQRRELLEGARTQSKVAQDPASTSRVQSLQDLYKGAESAANLKYAPVEREVQGEQRVSDQQQKNISGWFQEYQNQLQQIQGRTDAAYAQAGQANTDLENRSATLDEQQRQQLMAGMAADAAVRGASVDPSLNATAQQAAANRRTDLDAIGGVIAGQRANNTAYQGSAQRLGAAQSIQEHLKESNVRKNLSKRLQEILGDRGDFEATTRQDLLNNERKYGLDKATLESSILGKTLEQQQQDEQAGSKVSAATAGLSADDYAALTPEGKLAAQRRYRNATHTPAAPKEPGFTYGIPNADYAKMSTAQKREAKRKWEATNDKPGGKDKKTDKYLSTTAQAKLVSSIEKMRQIIATPQKWPPGSATPGKPMTTAEVINSLKNGGVLAGGKQLDPRAVEVAGNLVANKGKLGPYGVKQAHALKLRVNGTWPTI